LLAISDNAEPVTAPKYDATIKAIKFDWDKNKAASNLTKQEKDESTRLIGASPAACPSLSSAPPKHSDQLATLSGKIGLTLIGDRH
jgi:hypothetical protein